MARRKNLKKVVFKKHQKNNPEEGAFEMPVETYQGESPKTGR